jgi:hypothetical protein
LAVAIPAHDCDRRTKRLDRLQDSRVANIPEVPDFVRAGRERLDLRREFIVSVGEDEYLQRPWHSRFSHKCML